jgi:hypothetical protein
MVSAAAVTGEFRAARFGSEQYNSGMALTALAKKLFRTLARVFPQCGLVSQAVAFNILKMRLQLGVSKPELHSNHSHD